MLGITFETTHASPSPINIKDLCALRTMHVRATIADNVHSRTSAAPQVREAILINESNQNRMKSLELQFHKALRPLLIISEILVCAPVGLQNLHNQSNYCTFCRKCLQIVWGLIAYIAVAHGSYNEYFFLSAYLPTQEVPFYLSEFAFYLLHVLLIMLASYFGRKTFTFSLTFILDFDSKLLKHFKLRMHYKDLRKFLRNHLSLNFAFFLSAVMLGFIQRRSSLFGILTVNTSYTLPNVITQTSLIQYYALVYVVNKRMQLLYQLIEQTLQQSLKQNIFNVQQRLRVLRGLSADMDAYTKHLNDAFAIPLLLFFMASLKSLSFYIFTLYKWIDQWTDLSYTVISYAIIEICWQFSRAFLILHFNQAIQNQRKQAAILLTSFSSAVERLEPTINRFIMQLSTDPRNYIICGIIPLNMHVLMTMFFPVSALFIFLVQYDITYEALTSAEAKHEH
uniref:Gustatory receptor n=1 Tax=Glossina pallidipes TaxID=7398 RepID=A0A1B0ABK2_GLOPL